MNNILNTKIIPDENTFFLKKSIIIGYAGIIQFIIIIIMSKLINKFIAKEYDRNKSIVCNMLNLISILISMLVSYYWIRKFMRIIPYPLHNPPMFDVYKIKELKNSVITTFAYLTYLGDILKSYKPLYEQLFSLKVSQK